ncbi:MAG: hypothetical protein DMF53_04215 [Acidobacteria bacterium]|nr:MAG: hypothetical protein DMF53_04215 [Acidobacteriota bacterium]
MKNLTLSDLTRAVWRRRVWFLVPLLLGLVAAVWALRVLPRTYRASTLVLVEPQKVPADYVKPTIATSIEERLRTIEPQIKNRDNLARIIHEMDLYPELTRQGFLEGAIARARRDLTIQLQGNTFRIYFEGREPVQAARTANRVAESFIESNLTLRASQAQGTSSFLETELEKTKSRLEVQEAKIAEFKRQNLGDLPEQRDTNLRSVEQLQTKLEINMDALDKAETRRLLLQSQMAELRNQQSGSRRSTLAALGVAPAAPDQPSRLDQLRAQLAELRARYTWRRARRRRPPRARLPPRPLPGPTKPTRRRRSIPCSRPSWPRSTWRSAASRPSASASWGTSRGSRGGWRTCRGSSRSCCR